MPVLKAKDASWPAAALLTAASMPTPALLSSTGGVFAESRLHHHPSITLEEQTPNSERIRGGVAEDAVGGRTPVLRRHRKCR